MSSSEGWVFDLEHGVAAYTVHEISELCGVTVEHLHTFVEFGVLKPEGAHPAEWRFPPHAVMQARRAQRLQRDLELNLPGLALALELLDHIEDLRREVATLRAQLARFTHEF
ncbi:MAG: chaperone modulator CbpM [Gammaproteobacteria bacterium]